jgi:tetratricopeptide (TPR) repeat protein
MERLQITLEELYRLLPDVEELEELRLSIVGAAIPDPAKEWEKSSTYTTIDKRVISRERLEEAVSEAEGALHAHISSLFSIFRPLFHTFCAGQDVEAAYHLIEMGERQERSGRFRKARQFFGAALTVSLPLTDKRPQILALRRIGRVARALGEPQEALQYYQRSAQLARDAQELQAEVIARTGCANVLAVQGRWAEAERCYRNALALAEGAPDPEALCLERGQLYNNLAMITTRQHQLDEAESWFMRALDLWMVESSPADLAVCYHNLGLLRERQGRLREAREICERALALDIPSTLRAGIAIELADLHLKEGHLLQAERYGREAEEHAIAARSPYYLAEMYRGLGNIARARGDDDGFTFYEKALELARQKEYPHLEGETLVEYAILRGQSGGTEEARSYLERARDLFIQIGAVHEQARAEQALRELARPNEASAAD